MCALASTLPAFTHRYSGRCGAVVNRGEPHSEQKDRSIVRPLSAVLAKVFGAPRTMRNEGLSRRTPTLKALPVTRRQSAQW
jgi:hypothetical protein